MNRLLKFKPYDDSGKTLVIAPSNFRFRKYAEFQDKFFLHLVPAGRLVPYDPQLREFLQEYIEDNSCSQVIFIGSKDPDLIDRIHTNASLHSLKAGLVFNLKPLLRSYHRNAFDPDVMVQMLIESNVVAQCKLLMDYFFIKEKVKNKKLQIEGVVTEIMSDQLKSIFHNGIVYNDLLTLN